MKKALCIFMALLMTLSLAACGGGGSPAEQQPAGGAAEPADDAVAIDEETLREFLNQNSDFFKCETSIQSPADISEYDIIYENFFSRPVGALQGLFTEASAEELSEIGGMNLLIDGMSDINVFNIMVCDNSALQQRFDAIFGAGHTDVRSTGGMGGNPVFVQLSNDKTAIVGWGYGGPGGTGAAYEIQSFATDAGKAIVTAYSVYYSLEGADYGRLYNADGTLIKENNLRHSQDASFEEIMTSNSIDISQLTPVNYVFYMTEEGVRYWGCETSGGGTQPSQAALVEPAAPEVVPAQMGEETQRTVSANGGLRMRQGPGTDYDFIQLIPDGAKVRSFAEQDGWYYVTYSGRYGWVSGEYCS